MRRNGCENVTNRTLCRMTNETKTWMSWTGRQRSPRADVGGDPGAGIPNRGVFWEIWTGATGLSTRLVAS